jgi:hypothetical protein
MEKLEFLRNARRLVVTPSVVPSSLILVTLRKKPYVPPKRPFLQEPHGVTSHMTPFFYNGTSYFFGVILKMLRHRTEILPSPPLKLDATSQLLSAVTLLIPQLLNA